MPIIGTAGHVDHGKSTLVQALTGRDPDRWTEEKERGLTIDLGFAWAPIGEDAVGFVDVPGHERFIKNMLAGVGGLDIALFVVAADEGWMPQSEEHLAVLDLLRVAHGVIAITRVDLADPDLIELSTIDVEEHVADTVAESWPVVAVSAVTGDGIDDLVQALEAELAAAGPARDTGRPRMWIDRAFGIAGAGVVVTGTLTGGSLSVGDRLQCYPGPEVRVRSLQSHEIDRDTIEPGSRAAANLVGVDQHHLERGTLLAHSGSITMSERFLAQLSFPPRSGGEIADRGAYHVHIGTATISARIRTLSDTETPAVMVTTTTAAPLTMGDRFILRDTGRRAVVAGGTVLDPSPSRKPTPSDIATLAHAIDRSPDERAAALVAVHGSIDASEVEQSSGGGSPTGVITVGARYLAPEVFALRGRELQSAVEEYHGRYPLRPGLPKSEASSRLRVDADLVAALVAASGDLVEDGPAIRLIGFAPSLGTDDVDAWEAARALLAADLAVPRASDLGLSAELTHALIRRGNLVRIDDDLVLLADQIETIIADLGSLPDGFTVAMFRDHFGLSRRHAVPLLEWLDAEGWTRRSGDERSVSSPLGGSAGDAQPR
ncbi:MAG: selenocysteine-specific translation elongation factor [Acidimicrobiia bacterium]